MKHSDLRLGIVPYLNVLPLLEGLGEDIPESNWVKATPRELSRLLETGEIDFATLPIFDVLRAKNYKIMGKCSISCDGPVRSVRIFSKKPFDQVKSVLLDQSSLTSNHLTQIICREHLKIDPEFTVSEKPIPSNFDLDAMRQDAVLVIGDVALEWENRMEHELDLGQAWKEMTGLPFVFAAWATPISTVVSNELQEIFLKARMAGERNVYEIAKRRGGDHQNEIRDLVDYLSLSIRYNLGPKRFEAIELYRQKLIAHGLLPEDTPKLVVENPVSFGKLPV